MKYLRNDTELKDRRRELRRNQTEAEKAFWSKVRNRQFRGLKFFRQYGIGPYILDFYCPELKLGIELDGGQHLSAEKREYDIARSEFMKAHGIDVVRFWNNDALRDIGSVLDELEKKVTPHPPLSKGG